MFETNWKKYNTRLAGMLNVHQQRFRPWHHSESSTLGTAGKRLTTVSAKLLVSSRVFRKATAHGQYLTEIVYYSIRCLQIALHCSLLDPMFPNRYGSWAVCFTYGTWFGVKGLVAVGRTFENSPAIRKACEFLLSKELPSGGWGESYLSSQDQVNSLLTVSLEFNST